MTTLNSGSGNIAIGALDDSSGALLQVNGNISRGGALLREMFKNAVMNGSFDIWQRGASFTGVAASAYTADRWQYYKTSTATQDLTQSTDVPTFAQAGALATYSLALNCTVADAAIAAGDRVDLSSCIEGYTFRSFAQRALTMSFWVKSSLTGIYCVRLTNGGGDRSFVAEYTVNVANTWEKKTIAIPASPTAGTWLYDNTQGLYVTFTLMAGTTFQTTAGAWQTGNFLATSNQVNAVGGTSILWKVALVQLEVGNVATEFGAVPYEVEFARCQRFYEILGSTSGTESYGVGQCASTTRALAFYPFKVVKRAAPTVTLSAASHWAFFNQAVSVFVPWVTAAAQGSRYGAVFDVSGMTGLGGAGNATLFGPNSTAAARMFFDSEL